MKAGMAGEVLLCDTSFVGAVAVRAREPERFAHWPQEVVERIDNSTLAISVISLAETRFGYLKARWGEARIEREEHRLATFLHVPLDPAVVAEWGRLRFLAEANGWNVGDNDLWIAATASGRGIALVTCDGDQARIQDPALEVLHLPRDPTSRGS